MRVMRESGMLFYFALCPNHPLQSSASLPGIMQIFHLKQDVGQTTQSMLKIHTYNCFYGPMFKMPGTLVKHLVKSFAAKVSEGLSFL